MSNTVSAVSGNQTVTGALTGFVGFPGDTFNCNGMSVPIVNVVSTSELTLAYGWPGVDVVDSATWVIVKTSPQWSSAVQIHQSVQDILTKIQGGFPIAVNAAGPAGSKSLYDAMPEGFTYLQTTTNPLVPFTLFVKESDTNGNWSIGQALTASSSGGGGGTGGGTSFNSISIGTVNTTAPGGNAAASVTGTVSDPILNFNLPRGNVGPAPSMAIGTVSTGTPGSAATATIGGTGGAYTVNLGIPRGDTGPVPVISIGSVTSTTPGASAEASIGGTPSAPSLNLVLPRGASGPPPILTAGTVTTGAPGTNAAASVTGSSGSYALGFTVPRGDIGPVPQMDIGTVTTGTAGSEAIATISGTHEAPLLNLVIPRGASGAGTGDMLAASNLSDLVNKPLARTNLGLGSMATRNVTVSISDPVAGVDGDIWMKVSA